MVLFPSTEENKPELLPNTSEAIPKGNERILLVDEEKAKEMGIRAFVMKPLVMSEIAVTIRDMLD